MMDFLVYPRVKNLGVSRKHILDSLAYSCKKLHKKNGQISVHIIGDQRMKTLNRIHRGKEKTTDVLSFPLHNYEENDLFISPIQEEGGDIFISAAQIRRQAKEFDVSYQEEFTRMLVHGVLHVFGYDHETKQQAAEMFPLQESFVQYLCNK